MTYWRLYRTLFRAVDEAAALDTVWDMIDPHHYGPPPCRETFEPGDFEAIPEDEARRLSVCRGLGWFDEPDWVTGGEVVGGRLVYLVEGHPGDLDDGWYYNGIAWGVDFVGPYPSADEAAFASSSACWSAP